MILYNFGPVLKHPGAPEQLAKVAPASSVQGSQLFLPGPGVHAHCVGK